MERNALRQMGWVRRFVSLMMWAGVAMAATNPAKSVVFSMQTDSMESQPAAENGYRALDAQREKQALQILLKSVEKQIVSAAEAMPAVKYSFAPTDGEFKGVRSFGQQVKHLAATNHMLAAAALGEESPAGAGDEQGPEDVRNKPEILEYLNASFTHLAKRLMPLVRKTPPSNPRRFPRC
jgi:hypothetical protein